jgi:hypothetical protein
MAMTPIERRILARAERITFDRFMERHGIKAEQRTILPPDKQWEQLVKELMTEHQIDKSAASKLARKARPELLAAMVRDANK